MIGPFPKTTNWRKNLKKKDRYLRVGNLQGKSMQKFFGTVSDFDLSLSNLPLDAVNACHAK
tara:strand:- start:1218 stop:1400 length:183 start_codon:yes stop_codon:yes gene_type:complete